MQPLEPSWSFLPVDVIINIARRCGRREIQSCRLVSRHWCNGANFVVSSIHLYPSTVSAYDSLSDALEHLGQKFNHITRVTVDRQLTMNFTLLSQSMPEVTSLDCFDNRFKNASQLASIGDLKGLKQLNLGGSNIKGEMLWPFVRCGALETLDLWRTPVTWNDLSAVLPFMEHLTNLNLGYTKLKDTYVDAFTVLTDLQLLDLGNTAVGSRTLSSLSTLNGLKSLFLDYTKTDDHGLGFLSPLTNLVDLNLGNTAVSDAGLVHLSSLTNLMDLKLGHTTVSDVGLMHFSNLCNLMYVYLDGTNVRDGGVTYLTTVMPHVHVQIRLDTSGIQF